MSGKRKRSSSEDEPVSTPPTNPGVIYLSRIPNKMNVTIIRSYFEEYAPIGRIYLQLSSMLFQISNLIISFRVFFSLH